MPWLDLCGSCGRTLPVVPGHNCIAVAHVSPEHQPCTDRQLYGYDYTRAACGELRGRTLVAWQYKNLDEARL